MFSSVVMWCKNIFLASLCSLLCVCIRASQLNHNKIDILCSISSIHSDNFRRSFSTCSIDSSNQLITKIYSRLTNVLDQNGTEFSKAEAYSVETLKICRVPKLMFLPLGIGKKFPNMKVLNVYDCGLTHLGQEDVEPFGANLIEIEIMKTKLTALEGDLFQFNTNLVYLDFSNNHFKFISTQFFEGLNDMESIIEINFRDGDCINEKYDREDLQFLQWNSRKCKDNKMEKSNIERSEKRREAWMRIEEMEEFMSEIGNELRKEIRRDMSKVDEKFDKISEKLDFLFR